MVGKIVVIFLFQFLIIVAILSVCISTMLCYIQTGKGFQDSDVYEYLQNGKVMERFDPASAITNKNQLFSGQVSCVSPTPLQQNHNYLYTFILKQSQQCDDSKINSCEWHYTPEQQDPQVCQNGLIGSQELSDLRTLYFDAMNNQSIDTDYHTIDDRNRLELNSVGKVGQQWTFIGKYISTSVKDREIDGQTRERCEEINNLELLSSKNLDELKKCNDYEKIIVDPVNIDKNTYLGIQGDHDLDQIRKIWYDEFQKARQIVFQSETLLVFSLICLISVVLQSLLKNPDNSLENEYNQV